MTEHPLLLFLDVEAGGLPTVSGKALSFDFPILCLDAVLWHPDQGKIASSGTIYFDDDELNDSSSAYEMHQASGLLDRWRQAERIGFEQADEMLVSMIDSIVGTKPAVLLAGNSVGGYDLPIVQIHLPRLHQRLRHRALDTSSLRHPAAAFEVDLDERTRAAGGVYDHTSSSDVAYCIKMYEQFLDLMKES